MYSASSRGSNVTNADGSRNVHCWACQTFIMKTYLRMDRSLCALCELSLSGKEIPETALREYMMSKADTTDVSMLVLDDATPKELKKFSLRSMGAGIMRALGIAKAPAPVPESVTISRQKKRPRLFENVDLDKPADMLSTDAALRAKQTK